MGAGRVTDLTVENLIYFFILTLDLSLGIIIRVLSVALSIDG